MSGFENNAMSSFPNPAEDAVLIHYAGQFANNAEKDVVSQTLATFSNSLIYDNKTMTAIKMRRKWKETLNWTLF